MDNKLKVLDANILYIIGAFLFITLGSYFQGRSLLSGLIITQYILILLPPLIYLKGKAFSIKKTMRFNRISFKHGMLVTLITLLMYPTAIFANALMMTLMSFVGNLNIPALPTATSGGEYIVLMVIISVSAGICEEVFFRGFILSGYERLGQRKAIIISAVLFGLFHLNLYNLAGPIVLGLVFGYLVILTDSIYAGIIGHTVNNGFAVTLGFAINRLIERTPNVVDSEPEIISTTTALLFNVMFFGIIAIATGYVALRLVRIIKKDLNLGKEGISETLVVHKKEGLIKTEELMVDEQLTLKTEVTEWWEFAPLALFIPLFLFVAFHQLREIILLG
ncbi:Abortive infection protein [Alkaliphilus metalliredigens QYMF]|uniref:Abortive infection protein n=1 Tax=Alkaliphilus metalliredigens (strain QYMF) TaxID=293826 RepID=A6TNN2_ALKMQ|nr:type II CAAX endopeptidase family protein [Alkaliphilus metalliredigens]ABR47800.1 Abortive infection protein [Alkaliphilus metalliredigens QYMF]